MALGVRPLAVSYWLEQINGSDWPQEDGSHFEILEFEAGGWKPSDFDTSASDSIISCGLNRRWSVDAARIKIKSNLDRIKMSDQESGRKERVCRDSRNEEIWNGVRVCAIYFHILPAYAGNNRIHATRSDLRLQTTKAPVV